LGVESESDSRWPPPGYAGRSSATQSLTALPENAMNRFAKLVFCLVALAPLALAIDYWNVTRKERLLSRAVSRIGGRNGSIPVWPLGTEYRITLTAVPNVEQLDELRIANQMRGWVGIAFEGCDLNQEDVDRIRQNLPACHLFVVHNGRMTTMTRIEREADEQ
jgi:hypothetical protein